MSHPYNPNTPLPPAAAMGLGGVGGANLGPTYGNAPPTITNPTTHHVSGGGEGPVLGARGIHERRERAMQRQAEQAGRQLLEGAEDMPVGNMRSGVFNASQSYGRALSDRSRTVGHGRKSRGRQTRLQEAEGGLTGAISRQAELQDLSRGDTVMLALQADILSGQERINQARDSRWYHRRGARIALGIGAGLGLVAASIFTSGFGLPAAVAAGAKIALGAGTGVAAAAANSAAERRLQQTPEAVRATVGTELGRVATGLASGFISLDPDNARRIARGEWGRIDAANPDEEAWIDDLWRGTISARPNGHGGVMGLSAGAEAQAQASTRARNRSMVIGGVVGGGLAAAGSLVSYAYGHNLFPWQHGGGAENAAGAVAPPPVEAAQPVVDINQHAWNVAHDLVGPEKANGLIDRAIDIVNSQGGDHYSYEPGVKNGMILYDGHSMTGRQRDVINWLMVELMRAK